jgi:hypothetical protein
MESGFVGFVVCGGAVEAIGTRNSAGTVASE